MNIAITDGLVFMPPAFAAGLSVWSSENGTAGSVTYQGSSNAVLVPADQDFGGCLEMTKTQTTQKLRWMGEVPIIPGVYLRVSVRVKAMSGPIPSIRIAGYAMTSSGHVNGLVETGAPVAPSAYGDVVTLSAIVGSGARTGVDMIWGTAPIYGHFGLDLTGTNGGVIRIDDIVIEDVTQVFQRKMMDWVDVRDYGAKGDGVTDDRVAFEAADDAAAGRTVLVSAGTYRLNGSVTFESPVRFEGKVVMPAAARLALTRNFDFATYAKAFDDEREGLVKAIQALFNFTDHTTLDLCGRRIELDAPIDVQQAVGNQTGYQIRRVIRNGQFNIVSGPGWTTGTATATASYSAASPRTLSGIANVDQIEVGSLVSGTGVGREVYVLARNVAAGTLTLSQPLFGPATVQSYAFKRFRYVLDFSNFAILDKFELHGVEFMCNGLASGVMLAPDGQTFGMRDCVFNKPLDRAVTSTGIGCQSLHMDQCELISNEQATPAQDRTTIAMNINANDAKIRGNRAVRFAHFLILNGDGHLLTGNHFFQGDSQTAGLRRAGVVLTQPNTKTTITGNYVDNSFIELTNEHDAAPGFSDEYSFGGLTITGNIFTVNNVAPWFRWIVITPYGEGHFIHGLTITGNVFRTLNGNIDRVEMVDTSRAALDMGRTRNLNMYGNVFNGITQLSANPVMMEVQQTSAAATWTADYAGWMPFGGWARGVQSVVAVGRVQDGGAGFVIAMPAVAVEQGAAKTQVQLLWPSVARGKVQVTARCDNPN